MDNTLSLDAVPVEPQLSLDTVTPAYINSAAATTRAAKADVGLGNLTKQSYDDIYKQISGGQEDTFRQGAAATMDYKDQENRQKALTTMAAQSGKMLGLKDVQEVLTPGVTNPDSVIERAYAEAYTQKLKESAAQLEDSILTTAQANNPEAVDKFFNAGSDILARREYAISNAQNIQSKVQDDAWFHVPFPETFGGPIAIGSSNSPWHTAINWATLGAYGGFRNEYLMRGNTPGTSRLSGIFEGNNVREQALELLRQPTFEKYKELFDKGFNRLKEEDPAAAQQWAQDIAGMSTNDMILRDFMSTANLIGAAGLFKGIKSGLGAVGKSQADNVGRPIPPSSGSLSQGPDGTYRPGGPTEPPSGGSGGGGALPSPAVDQARKAVEDVLRSSPASPTKANIAEAVGDSPQAAIQKTIVSTITQPNLERDAVDTLFDLHRTNQENIRSHPGNNSREEHTRLLDAGDTFEKTAVDTITKTSQLVRLPALAEEGFKSVADRTNQFFKGRENTIVNIDMAHDVVDNTHWHVYTLGNYNGEPFWSLKSAENHANINGYGKPKYIGNDPDIVYLPKSAVLERADSFKTSKGSEYTLHEDGQTVRNKTYDDKGLKPLSEHTGYITTEELKALTKAKENKTYAEHLENGKLHLFTDVKNGVHIQARNEPAIGLHPVEILPDNQVHYGNAITELNVGRNSNKVRPRTNFVSEKGPHGWSFHLDDPKGTRAEVVPSVEPGLTDIPFNIKTGKFGQPLAEGPHIVQKGLGFHIKWMIPLNEQDNWLRENHLITGPRTKSSSSEHRPLINGSFLGYFRLPQDTLSAAENDNRFKLVYGDNRYMNLVKNEMRYVEDLFHGIIKQGKTSYLDAAGGTITGRNKQLWNDFKRSLVASQKLSDPDTGLPGYYMKTPAEIQHFWQTNFGRAPSMAEQQSYLAVGRLDYADWVFRNISVSKNKNRLGVMEHKLTTYKDGQKITSTPFEGRFVSKLPEGNTPVVIMDRDGSVSFYNAKGVKGQGGKTAFKEEVARGGWKIVQLYDPDRFDIKVFDKDQNPVRVIYVVSNSLESAPIGYKQVGYRGGGHWDYNYDHYIKQPIIRKFTLNGKTHWNYSGDATFSPIKSNADGQVFTSKLNEIMRLLRDRKIAEAKAVHQSYSDMPWKDFVKSFYPRKGANGLEPARFNFHEDFRVVPKGFTIAEYDKNLIKKYEALPGKFINSARGEGSLARNYQVEFTGTRDSHDLFEPINTGTLQNPMYKFQPAELTDPITTLTRSLKRIMTSQMGDDYKYSAVEHWLQENLDMMNSRPEEVRGAPFATFMNGELNRRFKNSFRGGAAESNRYKIKKLIGMPTYADSQIQMYKAEIADMIFETNTGTLAGKAKKAALVPAEWTLGHISSPTNFVRGMAFHQNLGFWNWAQIAAQNTGYLVIAGQSPDHALAGMFGAWMHHWAGVNNKPAILKGLGNLTEQLHINPWKPGEWEEARNALKGTGFAEIGNTLAIHDTQKNFLASRATTALRKGTVFFDWAESNVRLGAWYTAYHEFKRAYPNQKIGDVEIGKIGSRANNLYANMGRDSKTVLNTGVFSMPLQFFKYIENVGQLFFSKRIGDVFGKENNWKTRATQRAQVFALYALMFGPVGATGLSLLPINDWVRESAIENGYVSGQNLGSSLAMEGPTSVAGAYLSGWWRSGQWDMSKGTFYNFNDRYGANGYQILRDLLEPSPVLWKVLLGASGSTLANNLASLSPFVYAMKSAFNDEQDNPFKLTVSDWNDGLANVNSWRYGQRLVYALEFGKWLDRPGRHQDDVGKIDAIFRTLLGVNDQAIDDMYLKSLIKHSEKDNFAEAAKDYQHYRRLAEEAVQNKDLTLATKYNKDAMFVLKSRGVPAEEAAKIFASDANLNKNSLDTSNDSFYKKLVPTYREDNADKAFQQIYKKNH